MPKRFLICALLAAFLPLTFVPSLLMTGCVGNTPVAAAQDAVIVNAQRIQRSSLDVYEQVINWEYSNRTNLPVQVSRTVDKYRLEFPAAWQQSRLALREYQSNRGDSTNLARVNAALSAVQYALLQLQLSNGKDGEVNQAARALTSLVNSIKVFIKQPNPSVPTP